MGNSARHSYIIMCVSVNVPYYVHAGAGMPQEQRMDIGYYKTDTDNSKYYVFKPISEGQHYRASLNKSKETALRSHGR